MSLIPPADWTGTSADPHDVQLGDVVEPAMLDDAEDYDAVFVGEPYDGGVISRRGAAEAPAALRESLAAVKTHHFEHGAVDGVGDLGDVQIPEGDTADVQHAVETVTERVHDTAAFPVFLGGDNSLTVPNVRPLCAGSVGVVSLDAHLDCREPVDAPTSGTPYYQLFEAGLDALAVVGARHFETTGHYADYLHERGGSIHSVEAVRTNPAAAAASVLDGLDVDTVYVSLDADVLDQTHAPGVSAPTPGGLRTAELYELLGTLVADSRVAGFEVVECAPPLDSDGRTVRAVARAVAHVLAGVTSRE